MPQVLKDHNGSVTPATLIRFIREDEAYDRQIAEIKAKQKAHRKRAADTDGISIKELQEAVKLSRMEPSKVIDRHNKVVAYLDQLSAEVKQYLNFASDITDASTLTEEQRNKTYWNQGRAAGIAAKNRDDCPHDPNSEAGRAWNDGWASGQAENAEPLFTNAPKSRSPRKSKGTKANDPAPSDESPTIPTDGGEDDQPPAPPTAEEPAAAEEEAGDPPPPPVSDEDWEAAAPPVAA